LLKLKIIFIIAIVHSFTNFFFSYFTRWQLKKCNAKHIKKTIKKLHSTTKQVKLKSKKIKGIFQKQNAKTLQYLCYFYLI